MALRGIDVSGWQPDIDMRKVDADFAIVKATGGASYTSPAFRRQADDALAAGKLLGVYHFAGDGCAGSAAAEARHFLEAFAPYRGRAIPILDWEAEATSWSIWWAWEWLDIVAAETGAVPWFYSYSSYVNSHDCSPVAGYPLWIAAYYAGYESMGYQADPPLYGGTGAWERAIAYQYSSTGVVDGYGGRLDINIFYGSREAWAACCGGAIEEEEVDEMQALYRPDGKGYMVWYDGHALHQLDHPDEMEAVKRFYHEATGRDIPVFEFGSKEAPWAHRFEDAVMHGFEQKHL